MKLRLCLVVVWVGMVSLLAVSCRGPTELSKPDRPVEASGAGAKAMPSTIIVSPMSGLPLARVTVYGSGFVPGEKVRVFLSLEGARMVWAAADSGGMVVANEYGAFELKPEGGIPPEELIKPGVYSVEAIGDKDSLASTPLVVLEKKVEKKEEKK